MAREARADPRYVRVRSALVESLFVLAGSTPPEAISVSDLSAAAGVSRQAFYGHATSPAALLVETLAGELEEVVDVLVGHLRDVAYPFERAWREAYKAVLDHVSSHASVYAEMVESHSRVFNAVVGIFQDPARVFVEAVAEALDSEAPDRLWIEMAVEQQVANLGAVIRAWVATGMHEDVEQVVDTYMTLAPPWQLARRDASGHITMRRARALRR